MKYNRRFYISGFGDDNTEAVLCCFACGIRIVEGTVGALYSDELFGTERMLRSLNLNPDAQPRAVLENVMNGIDGFVLGAEQFDDITMLCFKYKGQEGKGN